MKTHIPLAKNVYQPLAPLTKDLKSRRMLDETLLVCSTEFGRRPGDVQPDMAGWGHHECHIRDFHATILNQRGLDHTKLTYRHDGRDYRLTDVSGHVVRDILA